MKKPSATVVARAWVGMVVGPAERVERADGVSISSCFVLSRGLGLSGTASQFKRGLVSVAWMVGNDDEQDGVSVAM